MVDFEGIVYKLFGVSLALGRIFSSTLLGSLGWLYGWLRGIYGGSSDFTKRVLSGAGLLIGYVMVIATTNFVYGFAMILCACLSVYEVSLVVRDVDAKKYASYMKLATVVSVVTFGSLLAVKFSQQGTRATMWLFVTVAVADTIGYAVGKSIGKTKILPNISPNKTLEGFIGGICGATLINLVLYPALRNYNKGLLGFLYFAFASVALVIAANLGDVLQSIAKRKLGVKDMGTLIPGHGGITDRMDSFIIAAPVALLLIILAGGQLF